MKKTFKEFKEFISKGNVIDMAVGVIIGSSFSKIVSSLVNDVVMPLISIITGGFDFTTRVFEIKDVTIKYGLFIQNVVDFLIIAICIFTAVKIINKLKKLKPEEPKKEEPPKKVEPEEDIKLLTEIRDLLKKQK